jgi:hypothetical protein
MSRRPVDVAIGGNAHLPATEHPSEQKQTPSLPPDEIDIINQKSRVASDDLERPYDPGGLSDMHDQPERRNQARPEGTGTGETSGGVLASERRDRSMPDKASEDRPTGGTGTTGVLGESGGSSKPV